jgi:hypothetical protein
MPTSANSYGPYDAGAGANITENFWRLFARWFAPSAVVAGYLLELLPFGDSTGLQAKINTGGALVRGAYGEWTGTTTLGLAAVGGIAGGSERWDRLIVRNDFVNNVMQLDVLTGTSSASPSAVRPALTQTTSMYEMLLADVGPLVSTTTTVTAAMVLDGRWKISETGILFYEVAPSAVSSVTIPAAGSFPAGKKIRSGWKVRTTSGNSQDLLQMIFNGDAAANYDWSQTDCSSIGANPVTSTAASVALIRAGSPPGGLRAAGVFGQGWLEIMYYLDVVSRKTALAESFCDGATFGQTLFSGQWHTSNTALLNMGLSLSAGNYAAGSSILTEILP